MQQLLLLLLLLVVRMMLLLLLEVIWMMAGRMVVAIRGRVQRLTIRRVALVLVIVRGIRIVLRVRRDRHRGHRHERGTQLAHCQGRDQMLLMPPAGHTRRGLDWN
jgi:hypothetical protein